MVHSLDSEHLLRLAAEEFWAIGEVAPQEDLLLEARVVEELAFSLLYEVVLLEAFYPLG